MNFVAPDFLPLLPELFVLTMACAILVIDVFLDEEKRHISYGLSQLTVLGAAALIALTYANAPAVTMFGHYIKDAMGDLLKFFICLAAAAVFLYSRDYLRQRDLFKGEYYVLGLFGVLGMMIMVSAHSLLSVYLGLELLSLSLYALVAFDRDSPVASEAAMKFFVLGSLASGMLLYGISMIYGATGSVDLQVISDAVAKQGSNNLVLVFGLVFLVVGLAFKLGAVPFHMWLPDVYQGAPTSVTLYIGSAPKLAAFALVMRVLVDGLGALQGDWQQMLVILSVLSMAVGNLIAIAQTNIKRMLAYSTISHVGFLLLGILSGTPEGYAAAMFYAIIYVLMATGAFGVVILLSRAGFEAENISDFSGLNDRNPWLAFLMMIIMMSMAGIPFMAGFYAKWVVLQSVVEIGLVWLALVGVIFSVIGAFYYLRVVKCIYFDKSEQSEVIDMSRDVQIAISANGLLLIVLGLYPAGLMAWCASALLS
ncbi:MAG TPA: NADH-quinone oxidoreductase subunit NuoN [Candidatus Competibacter sp.]|nr:NADH-quinone oxidoreductase subunit NuoN [Candidatus Competibacteraceae bacterium]HRE54712.1 NADH-quinone oxidoreductase subunit NuoN [Candidatus Competibacter sp.]HUM93849.1 NADH-quinone oxidoreductase subunit NuoN [Candidatus Competibacter sp.]